MIALIVMTILLGALGLASQLGWSVDSRDGADWRPTNAGTRSAGELADRG